MTRENSTVKRKTPARKNVSPNAGDIYRKAAQIGANGAYDGSCVWIAWVPRGMIHGLIGVDWERDKAVIAYQNLFRPEDAHGVYWGNLWSDQEFQNINKEQVRECRILALCFMAAIVENP